MAAAALTLTATGSAVLPIGSGSTAAADGITGNQERSPANTQVASSGDRAHVADTPATTLSEQLAEAAADARAQAQRQASRAAHRQQLEQQKERRLAKARRWVPPVDDYRLTSGFGSRWGRLHAGNDFAAPIGTPVRSVSQGTVIFAGPQAGYGNKVEIRHWDGTVTWYAHMSRITTRVGDSVAPGEQIGAVGNTGRSTGPHLHLQVHPANRGPVDPRVWLADRGLRI